MDYIPVLNCNFPQKFYQSDLLQMKDLAEDKCSLHLGSLVYLKQLVDSYLVCYNLGTKLA